MTLDNMLLALSALPIAATRKTAVTVVEKAAALHPLVFLPFHLISHHLTARACPKKAITYPAHLAFTVTQYAIEHFSAELPSLASFGQALVGVALLLAPYTYYRAFKTTQGPKWLIWAGLAVFLIALPVFKGLELGFPKDTPEEQAVANLDRTHSLWHLVLHIVLVLNGLLVSYGVPWTPQAEQPLVPPSPVHSTRAPRPVSDDEPCSPAKACSPVKASWSKAKAA